MIIMENIKFKIKDLFSSSTKKISTEEPLNVPVSSTTQREGETYKHWGLRVCAIADGNIHTLVPSLHSCYQSLYRQKLLIKINKMNIVSNVMKRYLK